MYKNNTFSEILKLLDSSIVKNGVSKHNSDKYHATRQFLEEG
jgi:hypothetical protein